MAARFQSSPALSSGRYALPPALYGDGRPVSILARPFERALPSPVPCTPPALPVSILARPFERALPPYLDLPRVIALVSILARPFERALRARITSGHRHLMFQSSPALSSGRYMPTKSFGLRPKGFNPRPPFRAGATRRHDGTREQGTVSILARPFERALPRPTFHHGGFTVFQSSPALSSGRYFVGGDMLTYPCPFQSSPALSSGRYTTAGFDRTSICWFQSSPALSSGRYRDRRVLPPRAARFNPRPPFRAGATRRS